MESQVCLAGGRPCQITQPVSQLRAQSPSASRGSVAIDRGLVLGSLFTAASLTTSVRNTPKGAALQTQQEVRWGLNWRPMESSSMSLPTPLRTKGLSKRGCCRSVGRAFVPSLVSLAVPCNATTLGATCGQATYRRKRDWGSRQCALRLAWRNQHGFIQTQHPLAAKAFALSKPSLHRSQPCATSACSVTAP